MSLRSTWLLRSALLLCVVVFLTACSENAVAPEVEDDPIEDPVEPEKPRPADPALGKTAFETTCAPCHASGDAFDLAYFAFSSFDIARRAVMFVDTVTALDIVAFVRTQSIGPGTENLHLFQPGSGFLPNDRTFWSELFGTEGWPDDLTPEQLRAINPRDVSVGFTFFVWSSETSNLDWMPQSPLPSQLLSLDGGALQTAVTNYRSDRTETNLVDVLTLFKRLTTDSTASATPLCAGEVSLHANALECFDARRWVSNLAATHYLRNDVTSSVPIEVAQTWWDTGEAAVSLWVNDRTIFTRRMAATWLYLGFSFAPEAFPEPAGYMTQLLQSSGHERLATFAALRRMVGSDAAHETSYERFWDASLAVLRAPKSMALEVAKFAFTFLRDRLLAGMPASDPSFAALIVGYAWNNLEAKGATDTGTELESEVVALRDELIGLLE